MSLLDLIAYPTSVMRLTGIWPKSKFSLIYKLRSAFTLGNIFLLTLCLTYNANFHSDNFIKLSESLYILISVLNSLMKMVMISLNGKAFLKLLGILNKPSFTKFNDIYCDVISDYKKIIKKVTLIYWIDVHGAFVFMALFPVIESKPLPMDFPHFNNGTYHYPFYVFETVSLYIAAYGNTALDLLTVGIISIAAVQLKILNRKLMDTDRNVARMSNYSEQIIEKLTLEYLNECCSHFCDIEEFVSCLLDVFSVNIFVQLGISVVAICNSGILILTVEPASIEAFSLFCYISAMFAQLGMYCWFGNVVYLESLEVTTCCYMSNWYERGTAVRKTLFMLMERTKRPLEIRGIKFVSLNFNTFIAILKWSYSYFTLLRNYMTQI